MAANGPSVETRANLAALKTLLIATTRPGFSYVVVTLAIFLSVSLLLYDRPAKIATATHGGQCQSVDWEVGGKEPSGWEWVVGTVTVFDATAPDNYIESVTLAQDASHLVEWGWYEINGSPDTRKLFAVWRDGGGYNEVDLGTASTGSREFSLGNGGNGNWAFYLDDQLKWSKSLSFSSGQPYSVRENHSSCNSSFGEWKDLQKCTPTTCYWWSTRTDHDADPHADTQWQSDTWWSTPGGQY